MEFDDLLGKNKIDLGISYRNVYTSKIIYRNSRPRFHYFKLHGSLNWLQCELCGQYYVNPDGFVIQRAYEKELSDANTCICSDSLRLKSVLVTPSIVRDIRDSNLLQIWKWAMEAIRTADKLIFVGYSLPSEDLAIKSIIMRGLNGRTKKRPLKVDVVQLGEDGRANYVKLFGHDINYCSGGLPEYLS